MPIHIDADLRPLEQAEFGEIAYRVMDHVFQVHRELGRLFEEDVYQIEVARRLPGSRIELPVEVCCDDFRKEYFLDLWVAPGAIFEFKAVEQLHPRHRAQLLNYLLLTGMSHGKLLNLRPERVEHEFVNTTLIGADRVHFAMDVSQWSELDAAKRGLRDWLEMCLRDWGTGLDIELYEAAVTHFFGGQMDTLGSTAVIVHSRPVGVQEVRLAGPGVSFKVTVLNPSDLARHEESLQRFLDHTTLLALQWINVHRSRVTFKTLRNGGTAGADRKIGD